MCNKLYISCLFLSANGFIFQFLSFGNNCSISLSFNEQGVQPCAFYMRNGYCKFGPTCKFDHPIRTVRYSPSASSLTDIPVAPYMVGSSLATLAPSFSYASLDPHSSRIPSSGNTLSSSAGLIFSQTVAAPFSNVQLSGQSSSPLSISMSTRQGDEVRRSS